MYIVTLNATISPVNAKGEQLVSTLKLNEYVNFTMCVEHAVVYHPDLSGTVQLWSFRRSPEVFAPKTSQLNVSLCPDLLFPFSDVLFSRAVPCKPSAMNLQLRLCLSWKST